MDFSSKTTIPSKLPEFAGVSFTVHVLNEPRRLKARLLLADTNRKLREIRQEAEETVGKPLTPEASKDYTPEDWKAYEPFGEQTAILTEGEITPAWIRALLISVNGLTIDGKAATVESFLEDGPQALQQEIAAYVNLEAGLTRREEGESVPPSTSSAPADGRPTEPDLEKERSIVVVLAASEATT